MNIKDVGLFVSFLFISIFFFVADAYSFEDIPTDNKIIYDICFSETGEVLAVADGRKIRFYKFSSAEVLDEYSGAHDDKITSIAFSPDSTLFASGGNDGTVVVWEVTTGNVAKIFNNHEKTVSCLEFSNDGKYLASGSLDNTVAVYSLKPIALDNILNYHSDDVLAIEFSHCSSFLVSAGVDMKLKIYDLIKKEAFISFGIVENWIRDIEFKPGSNELYSVGDDKCITGWEIEACGSMKRLERKKYFRDWITSIDFSEKGDYFVIASVNGIIEINAKIIRLAVLADAPVNKVLIYPGKSTNIFIVAATRGEGVLVINSVDAISIVDRNVTNKFRLLIQN